VARVRQAQSRTALSMAGKKKRRRVAKTPRGKGPGKASAAQRSRQRKHAKASTEEMRVLQGGKNPSVGVTWEDRRKKGERWTFVVGCFSGVLQSRVEKCST